MAGLGSLSNKINDMTVEYLKIYGVRRNKENDRLSINVQIQILHDYSGWMNLGTVSGSVKVENGRVVSDLSRVSLDLYDQARGYARNITYYSATAYNVSVSGYHGVLNARVE